MANSEQVRALKAGVAAWTRYLKQGWRPYIDLRGAVFFETDLTGADLANADLRGAECSFASLADADLTKADLRGADFSGADLRRANLNQSEISGVNFEEANLAGVTFWGCTIKDSNLCLANLSGAELYSCGIRGSNLKDALLGEVKFDLIDLSGCDLRGVDLRDKVLDRMDLTTNDLRGADLRGASLRRSLLRRKHLRSMRLKGADLSHAKLSGVDLSSKDLSGTRFYAADLSKVNFRNADLSRSNFRRASLARAMLVEANLQGASLVEACLESADMRSANLLGANFRRAKIKLADFRGATYDPKENVNITGNASVLDLATCEGLERAVFSSPEFIPGYISAAFRYAHREDTTESNWGQVVALALKQMRALRTLYPGSEPPHSLARAIQEINTEIIKYLAAHPKAMYDLRPRLFEELIAEMLAGYGWQVDLTKQTRDNGYDIFAISPDRSGIQSSWIIECKRFRPDRKVGIDIARSLYGVRDVVMHAGMLMLATTSHFTKGVHDLKASRYDLELKDYEGILEWLNEYRPQSDGQLHIRGSKLDVT